jgi:transcription-repair coupling factor (superfamily II helicase)
MEGADGTTTQFLQLEYAQGDRIFVPVEHVSRLSKYVGDDVTLARLNSEVQRRSPYSRFQKPA